MLVITNLLRKKKYSIKSLDQNQTPFILFASIVIFGNIFSTQKDFFSLMFSQFTVLPQAVKWVCIYDCAHTQMQYI